MEIFEAYMGIPSPTAVADFTAGLVFGLTGDNHLTEIEQCFKSTDPMRVDLLKALDDFKHLNFIAGLQDFGDILLQLPVAFQDCTDMQDDITAIENWATIFKQPLKLTKTVSKNWLVHGVQIEADFQKEQADWAAEDYFTAGKDVADGLVLLVGPVNPALGIDYSPMMVPDLVSGFIWGQTGGNPGAYATDEAYKSYMESCYSDDPAVDTAIQQAIDVISKGGEDNIKQGVMMIVAQLALIKSKFDGCTDQATNVNNVYAYINYIKNMDPDERFATVIKNLKLHYADLSTEFKIIEDDFDSLDFFGTGWEAEIAISQLLPWQH